MHVRTHPLAKSKIQVPDIPTVATDHLNGGKDNNYLYEHVKYIFICKTFESLRSFKIMKRPQITRCYGVGILTDTNKYYFSELHIRNTELSRHNVKMFKQTLLTYYKIDQKTKIVLMDNIKNEPITAFIDIIYSVTRLQVRHTKELYMLRAINRTFNYVRPVNKKPITMYHKNKLIRRLLEFNRFEFIPDPDWYAKNQLKRPRVREAYQMCAIGILYMHVREYLTNFDKKYKKQREEKV